ncbi:hypothetical protein VP275E431_P0079 [Vibrio phage 275E43-1]|nr:hypothetical protein VP275E431_P0079 [Vibrio phage 275E43-1]
MHHTNTYLVIFLGTQRGMTEGYGRVVEEYIRGLRLTGC